MGVKRKHYVTIFVCLCLVATIMFGSVFVAANTDEYANTPEKEVITYEDVLAGEATLEEYYNYIGEITTSNVSLQAVSDGIYYMNNKLCGDYLNYQNSILSVKSELNPGNKAWWYIESISGGYVIRSYKDNTKYLAVPTSTTSDSVELVTVSSGSTIPSRCKWDISISAVGGCLIKSLYNSRYLYETSNGTSVKTTTNPGTAGSYSYDSCVWRILGYSELSNRQLKSSTIFNPLKLSVGGSGTPNISASPSNALWASPTDFTYQLLQYYYTTESRSVFTGIRKGVTAVIATHKVTDQQFLLTVVVGTAPIFDIKNYVDNGFIVLFGSNSIITSYNNIVGNKFSSMFGINYTSSIYQHTSSADTCKISQFGSVNLNNLGSPCPHTPSHITFNTMIKGIGEGTSRTTKALWTGHILKDEANAGSFFSLQAIIVTPRELAYKVGSEYIFNTDLNDMLEIISWTLFHELSHQLGLPDHYCYGDLDAVTNKCSNPNCYRCNKGLEPPECTMTRDRYLPLDQCNPIDIYCRNCLITITAHLTDHH